MKYVKFISLLLALNFSVDSFAQNQDLRSIEQLIHTFAKAGDNNDAELLSSCLDDNYRVVMNRLFGSEELSVMPKSIYVEKIKNKEFGGDKREVEIKDVNINGNSATSTVIFKGQKAVFHSFLVMVKNKNGSWRLISDIPVIG